MKLESVHTASCNHYWVIEAANGPISRGVCRHCHEVRGFQNSIDESTWRTRSGSQPRARRDAGQRP